jgi:hypothetical protein
MENPEAFGDTYTKSEVRTIRSLTGKLGTVVETTVLVIWANNGVEALSIDIQRLNRVVSSLRDSLDVVIASKVLRPVPFSISYQRVILERWEDVCLLFQEVDVICRASGLSFSFSNALSFLAHPDYRFGRYWVEAALMIAKESCLKPVFSLPEYTLLKRSVRIGPKDVEFDGLVVQCFPRLDAVYEVIQRNSLYWEAIEMKAIFAWWRNVGRSPLQRAPSEYSSYFLDQIESAAVWYMRQGNKSYYPDHERWLCCLRGWRSSLFFHQNWQQERWEMISR